MSHGKLYVGNLPAKTSENDLSDIFAKYGEIRYIDLKRSRGTAPYAFIQYESEISAYEASWAWRVGYIHSGNALRVEVVTDGVPELR
jgi:arginine/serine-rich splicing factor 1/9